MATKFRLKRSAVATKRPEVSDLLLGELALNTSDAFLFTEYTRAGTGTTVANLTPWQEKWGKNAVYYSGGSVGIGTTNPTSLVEVYGSNPVFTIQDNSVLSSNASATLRLAESDVTFHTGNYWDISHTTNNELAVSTGVQGGTVSEVLRIDGAGFVGINSADPRTHLEVVGITSTKELYVAGLSTFVGVATFKSDVWIDVSLFVKGVEIGPGHGITTPNLDIHDYVRHYGDLTTRFDYHNRMRLPEYREMFSKLGYKVIYEDYNKQSDDYIEKFKKINLNERFSKFKSFENIAGCLIFFMKYDDR